VRSWRNEYFARKKFHFLLYIALEIVKKWLSFWEKKPVFMDSIR